MDCYTITQFAEKHGITPQGVRWLIGKDRLKTKTIAGKTFVKEQKFTPAKKRGKK